MTVSENVFFVTFCWAFGASRGSEVTIHDVTLL